MLFCLDQMSRQKKQVLLNGCTQLLTLTRSSFGELMFQYVMYVVVRCWSLVKGLWESW